MGIFIFFIKNQIFLYYPLLFINQVILNIILSIQLLFRIKIIKRRHIANLITNINNKVYYFIKQAIIIIIEGFLIFFSKHQHLGYNLAFYLINIFQYVIIIISIVISFIISNKYKKLISFRKSFNNKINIFTEDKKYEINRKKVLVVIGHYFYKNICDLLLNIPNLLMISNTKFNQSFINILNRKNENTSTFYLDLHYYLSMFFGFLYLYIFCIMLLNVDYFNNGVVEKILNILFCVKYFHFYFGNSKKSDNSNIFYLNNSRSDKSNRNSFFQDESEYDDINKNINKSSSVSTRGVNSSFSDDSSDEEKEDKKTKIQYEYSPFNFFIIYKLLYIYFKMNKDIFLELEKNAILI